MASRFRSLPGPRSASAARLIAVACITCLALGGGRLAAQNEDCPPAPEVQTSPGRASAFFDIFGIGRGDASLQGDVVTRTLPGNPDIIPTEMVSLSLTGTSPLGPVSIRLNPQRPTTGQLRNPRLEVVEVGQPPVCVADSFFDVFVEITLEGQGLVLTNPIPIQMVSPKPIPVRHRFPFRLVQVNQQVPLLNAAGEQVGIINNTVHDVDPPRNPCPCFPPRGIDRMYSRLGHTLDIPGLGICAPLLAGPLVIERGDPYIDPATGLCCIDLRPVSFDLWGFDPLCGTVHITLNPARPSRGRICGKVKDQCFPADSCLELFIRVELPDRGLVLVNCDPIVMCCTIDRLPPYGCPYSIQNAPVPFYKEVAGADVCGLQPRPQPTAFLREATHVPEPPPTCPPQPVLQTSDSLAEVVIDAGALGVSELSLVGPVTTQVGTGQGTEVPIEILSMDLVGQGQGLGPVKLTLDLQRPSRGVGRNCRPDERFGDMVIDSFFDVFVEIELDDPRRPGKRLTLRNPIPVPMAGVGIPVVHNRPFELVQAGQPIPLVDAAGQVLARIVSTRHRLPPPPPPKCDCFPRAGKDRMRTRLVHAIEVPGIGDIRADCEGAMVVRRGDPYLDPATGLCVVDTVLEELVLDCDDPLVGPIRITLDRRRPSRGSITQLRPGECFPALSCFDVFMRVELRALGIVLVNCEPMKMCCQIGQIPPYGCAFTIQNPGVPLHREDRDPAVDVCEQKPLPPPVGFVREAVNTPLAPAPRCTCFPPAGQDVLDTNLWHEIVIPGVGTCRAALRGQVVIDRSDPFVDPATGKCCIRTVMKSMTLTGFDPLCGNITIELDPARASTGMICEQIPGTCFPADSFFDIFIRVTTERAGSFVNCEPARMESVIHSIPPYNAFYNLDLEGLPLYRPLGAADVCNLTPRPAPAATIGRALHVPRRPCDCLRPGKDVMDSVFTHCMDLFGLGRVCRAPLKGRVEVERGEPFLNDDGLCCQETEITFLELTGTDPVCGPVRITLNRDRASTGFACQESKDSCFPVHNCFRVFVVIEVMGLVLENCEPAIMCCAPGSLPPYDCTYLLNFGERMPLFRKGECGVAGANPLGEIQRICDDQQPTGLTPRPCPPVSAECRVVDGRAQITVTADPACPCSRFVVTRGDGVVIPPLPGNPLVFVDPEPCSGARTYKVVCVEGGAASQEVVVECPCQPCRVRDVVCDPTANGVVVAWTSDPAGCCREIRVLKNGQVVAVLPGTATSTLVPGACVPGTIDEYCVVCVDAQGNVGPPVCCKVECPCPERGVRDLKCQLDATGKVLVTWSQDPSCPCERVRITRDGAVIAEVPAAAGSFTDDCTPGDHRYCVQCVDSNGRVVGPQACCTITCPPPQDCCPEYGPGTDAMGSRLIHDIVLFGLEEKLCKAPLSGPIVVERGTPYVNAQGVCCVDTRMVSMELTGTDPVCGPVRIRLCPDRPSVGTICALERGTCFPALSCFEVFIEVEVMGMVLKNCQPVRMCCTISSLPPYGCVYQLDLGQTVPLFRKGDCGQPNAVPVGEIRRAQHVPEPCPPARVACAVAADGKTVTVNWATDPRCPCDRVIVTRVGPDGTETTVATVPAAQGSITDVPPCPPGAATADYTYCVQCVVNGIPGTRQCCTVTVRCEPEPCCPEYGPGIDRMDSTLSHDIELFGMGKICRAPLRGPMVVERGVPFRNENGLCCVETRMVSLDLTGTDPVCGEVKIRLCPEQPSTGFICQLDREGCFPARSCFNVFVEVEVMGMVLKNCVPAVMCCVISAVPPYGCVYQIDLGGTLPLFRKGDCGKPDAQPVGQVIQAQHIPQPPCRLEVACTYQNGRVQMRVVTDPECRCEEIRVLTPENVVVFAGPPGAPIEFVDPNCRGSRTYTVVCRGDAGDGATATCTISCRQRGDVNGDGVIDISDAVSGLNCLFVDSTRCPDCPDVMDTNGDDLRDISDLVYELQFLFLGGPPIVSRPVVCPVPVTR